MNLLQPDAFKQESTRFIQMDLYTIKSLSKISPRPTSCSKNSPNAESTARTLFNSLPTLVFSECVTSYIEATKVDAMLSAFNSQFDTIYMVGYEIYKPHDNFGKMMIKNFKVTCEVDQGLPAGRGIVLSLRIRYPYSL